MSVIDEVLIRIRALGAAAAAGEVGAVEKGIGSLGKTAKLAAGAAGIAGLAFGLKDVTEAAINFQAAQAQADRALHNTGQYSAAAAIRLSDAADTLSTHGGFDPTTSLSGLSQLVGAHLSVNRAISDNTLATDISRAKNLSYTSALRAVINAENGRTTGLSRLGEIIQPVRTAEDRLIASHVKATLAMREQAKAQDLQATKTAIMTRLWHDFHGAVQHFSNSDAGAISNFHNQMDILAQRSGKVLLPAISLVLQGLTGIVGALVSVADWLGKHKEVLVPLTAGLVAFAVATWGATVAVGALDLASTALQATFWAFYSNPIVLIIAAIALAVYELVTHFHDVKQAAIDAFHWIVGAARDAWHWIEGAASTLFHALMWPFEKAWAAVKWVYDHTIAPIIHAVEDFLNIGAGVQAAGHVLQHQVTLHHEHPSASIGTRFGVKGGRASGGPVYDSGMYLVGERGPEIVYLPRGADVAAHGSTGASGGGEVRVTAPILNTIQLDSRVLLRALNHVMAYGKSLK
jgi:hypothetical protein